MGYRLQMSAEIHDWLAGLRDSEPRSFLDEFFPGRADEVSQGAAALVAANRPPPR